MFEKLDFENQEEKKEFDKYIKLKGKFLFKQIYDVLIETKNNISYKDISSYIRYDKSLRDKLYIYFACAEEYLRTLLLDKYDVADGNKKYVGHCKNRVLQDLIVGGSENSNLYFLLEIDFGDLIEVCVAKGLLVLDDSSIKKIKDLRNKTMHHMFLLFGKSKTVSETYEYLETFTEKLNLLKLVLPEEYWKGFLSDIRKINKYKIFNKFAIGVKDDGSTICYEK